MIVFKILILIFSLVLHEIAHGYMAYFCGDNTAKYYGRLSLNPIKHLDLVGTLVPIAMIVSGSSFIIGWAKPVPINYYALKNGRVGEFLVAIAGIATNFILMIGCALLIRYRVISLTPLSSYFILINLALAIFNALPIPPLDGSRILASISNNDIRMNIFALDKYGILIIIILSYFGILSNILYPMYNFILNFLNILIRG